MRNDIHTTPPMKKVSTMTQWKMLLLAGAATLAPLGTPALAGVPSRRSTACNGRPAACMSAAVVVVADVPAGRPT